MRFFERIFLLSCLLIGLSDGAFAEGWKFMSYTMGIDGEDRDDFIDYSFDNLSVYYDGNGSPNLMLTCSERRGITVAFGLEDLDFEETLGKVTSKTRTVDVKFLIDGKRTTGITSAHLPTLKIVEPFEKRPGRMVFNSVVKKVPVELSVPGKGKFTYQTPPVDDVFKHFVKNCPVTAS